MKIQEALKSAIETIENADKLLATLGIIVDSRWSAESLNQCKSALSEIEKCELVLKVTSNGSQLSLTKPNGDYWDMSKHVGEVFFTSPKQREWKDIDLSEYENQGLGVIAEEICTKLKQLNAKG